MILSDGISLGGGFLSLLSSLFVILWEGIVKILAAAHHQPPVLVVATVSVPSRVIVGLSGYRICSKILIFILYP